jgi:hypothetical protein
MHPYRDLAQEGNPRYYFDESEFIDLDQIVLIMLIDNEKHEWVGRWACMFSNGREDYFSPETGSKIFQALKNYRR